MRRSRCYEGLLFAPLTGCKQGPTLRLRLLQRWACCTVRQRDERSAEPCPFLFLPRPNPDPTA